MKRHPKTYVQTSKILSLMETHPIALRCCVGEGGWGTKKTRSVDSLVELISATSPRRRRAEAAVARRYIAAVRAGPALEPKLGCSFQTFMM